MFGGSVAGGSAGVNAMLAAALDYGARGWAVLPLHGIRDGGRCTCPGWRECEHPGKHPWTKHGVNDATSNPERIREWWRERPNANVGLATGSRSGVVALDVDPRHGGDDALAALEAEYGLLPPSLTVKTGGGGVHHYFLAPDGGGRSVDRVAGRSGLELKGNGKLVVAPPSRHVSGRLYEWGAPDGPETALAPLPAWLAAVVAERPPRGTGAPTDGERIPEGERNNRLASLAGAMRQHGLSEEEMAPALLAINARRCDPPLAEEEVRRIAHSVARYEPSAGSLPANSRQAEVPSDAEGIAPQAEIVCLADVQPEPVRWLWPGRLPLGKVAIIDGDPALGKSLLALDVAARVTRGAAMPDGSAGDLDGPAGVVLLAAEDDPADTIVPRLLAVGGDPSRVVMLKGITESRGRGERASRVMRLPTLEDAAALREATEKVGAKLLIVDPLMAYLGKVDSHVDSEVRRTLAVLADLARATGVAVLAIRHLNKTGGGSPLYRGGGSIGIIASARSGMLVAADPEDATGRRRLLAMSKSNLAELAPTLAYELTAEGGAVRLRWLGATSHRAADLLAQPDDDRPSLAEAEAFLRETLADGPIAAREVEAQAREAGIAARTLDRAKARLGVVSAKPGGRFGGPQGWEWRLPEQADNLKGAIALKSANNARDGALGALQTFGALQAVRSAAETSDDRCHICGRPVFCYTEAGQPCCAEHAPTAGP